MRRDGDFDMINAGWKIGAAAGAALFVLAPLGVVAQDAVLSGPRNYDMQQMPGVQGYDDAMLPVVRDRLNDGIGLHAGSYWLFPTVEAGYFFDSNPLARSHDKKSSNGLYTAANVEAKSDFSRHALNFYGGVEHYEYLDVSGQSHTNGYGGTDFRIDVRRDLVILGGVDGGYFHETLDDVNTPENADEPIPYTELAGWGSINKAFNRIAVSLGAAYSTLDYSSVKAKGGGRLDQDYRDSEILVGGGRLSYLFSPGYRIFGDFRYNDRHYRNATDDDSHGYRALGGVAFEITRLLAGEVGLGYMWQDYDRSSEGTRDGFSYHLGLTWTPTPLITVNLDGDRMIADSSIEDDPSRIATTLGASIDYEFRRNIIISPAFAIANNDYSHSSNDNTSYEAGLDVEYYLNRHLAVGANYNYLKRDYKMDASDYDRHLVGVNAKARF